MKPVLSPIYRSKSLRVADVLAADIQQRRFPAGMLLPTESELAHMYHVSGMTMRKTLSILAEKGVVVRVPQKGTLVPNQEPANGLAGLREQVRTSSPATTLTISAVWAASPDTHLVGISEGVKKYAREAGLHLQLILSPEGHDRALNFLQNAENYPVEGALVLRYSNEEYVSALNRLVEKSFPLVCVDRHVENVPASFVEADNAAGEYQAVHYLIEKYHQPVYFFCCLPEHSTTQDRFHGYKLAMTDAGFDGLIDEYTFFFKVSDSDPTYWPRTKKASSSFAGAEEFLDKARLPACVVCMNDYAARGLYEVAERRGMAVGKDLHIIGFDDQSIAKFLKPSLTTIRQPSLQIGYDAARLLHHMILGKIKPPVHIHLPVEMVVRESA